MQHMFKKQRFKLPYLYLMYFPPLYNLIVVDAVIEY